MFLFLIIYALSLIAFALHLYFSPSFKRTQAYIIELLLLYQLVFSLGLTSLLAFIGLNFMPNTVNKFMGWTPCPYQQELANVNLAFGILGILSIWFRKSFWTATIIGFSIWIFGDALHHIYLIETQKEPIGNKLFLIFTDFFAPIVLSALLSLHTRSEREKLELNLEE
jgi:hypothetical protein